MGDGVGGGGGMLFAYQNIPTFGVKSGTLISHPYTGSRNPKWFNPQASTDDGSPPAPVVPVQCSVAKHVENPLSPSIKSDT